MMPSSLAATNVAGGMSYHHQSAGAHTVDELLSELSRQLIGNTRRYSRASASQQRAGNAMRISKPSSASNSPRSSALQARRKTLIGDGFRGGFQTLSPAMDVDRPHLPTPGSEVSNESFYRQPTSRSARPVSWHPSSQHAQPSYYTQQDAMLHAFPTYNDAEALASLQQFPPTPTVYSGYTSPADPFSPLTLPYSGFSSQQQQQQQQMYSPLNQPMPVSQQVPMYPPTSCASGYSPATTLSEMPQLRHEGALPSWEVQPTATFNQHTTPPTPEDFVCNLNPTLPLGQQQQQQQSQPDPAPQSYQTVIIHDDEAGDDSEEGEILYGMGLYDAPDHSKQHESTATTLHQSVVFSLLGSGRSEEEEEVDSGKGLGLKLEDAWEPPASDDEDDEEEEGEGEEDGEGQDD
ncbi:uncharacterized protein C8A04DRAFT_9198 [Dichotomopilus funicola]|uniref:Uncharacterized protein n=1 Tax=Dichotomopilus funicola TaxID=1934379 RepID=A0AAN6V9Y1_9PEZI|nr:hypothetical protein C8A04DRAFT_9198 [Dichotomopilus funicola]